MLSFDIAVNIVLDNEQGLEEDKDGNDPGGVTNHGISLRFLQACGLKYDFLRQGEINRRSIEELTIPQAKEIYSGEFWQPHPFQHITNQSVINSLFDFSVNAGFASAAKAAQRAICAMQHNHLYLLDDGVCGTKTLDEINHAGFMLLPALRSEKAAHYRVLAIEQQKDKEYLQGWLARAYKL